jgi:hypothetical protein
MQATMRNAPATFGALTALVSVLASPPSVSCHPGEAIKGAFVHVAAGPLPVPPTVRRA